MTKKLGYPITKNEFQSLCGKYLIDIGIALENQKITQLLCAFSFMDKKSILFEIEEILKNEF